ncbi:unnamed protein product [Cyprideis torosa]|uniref:Uncharacterized protein n=1 Tax=Cyprideis torosa TaxID=163714 RepID=A0A7R8WJE2_9CRUS|nr:unnamed protein product [Cyprideis torosa]CAG0899072.1 unnamed protein product [Cyprideis torosa]
MAKLIKKRSKAKGMEPGRIIFIGKQKVEKPRLRLIHYGSEHYLEKELSDCKGVLPYRDSKDMSWLNVEGLHDVELIDEEYCRVLAGIALRFQDSSWRSSFLRFSSETLVVEQDMHREFFSMSGDGQETSSPSPTCLLYTSYLHRQLAIEPIEVTVAAVLPCFVVYQKTDVRPALLETLSSLTLDYLDLYLIHWPITFCPNVLFAKNGHDFVHPEEMDLSGTWQAMENCVREGLVRHIGVELHPYLQQEKLLAYCEELGILVCAYSPLGSPDRPAHMKKKEEPHLLHHEVIEKIARRHGASPAQILIAWGLARNTAVLVKSVDALRLQENYSSTDMSLSARDMEEIATLERGYRYVDGSFFTLPDSGYTLENIWDE